ncbi:MAG: ABC transporter permease [Geminicoccaceae bacterium]|nr:ABC transporter permease [Geminicoccaceae bacterium]MDW8370781.1 ABC transporter permease [Geminicoccaceae bacterium]
MIRAAPASAGLLAGEARAAALARLVRALELVLVPAAALLLAAGLFALFLLALGRSPGQFFELVWRGAFASFFSWQNTLQRAAPLILAALCVALPARAGLLVIGGEGALVLGGFTAAAIAIPFLGLLPAPLLLLLMALVATATGAAWIGFAGWLRQARGVNETIATLLLTYIAIATMNFFVEGPLRDPASANKPSTLPIGRETMIGPIPGTEVHWGLAAGLFACFAAWILATRTTTGFALSVVGGNARAALAQGLPVGRLVLLATGLGGAAAGLAGFFEVAAIHGQANASLAAGYGFTAILVSFLARHHPLAIPPVAILFGGLAAAGGLVQRRMGLPDATMLVLQGILFVTLLAAETLRGRLPLSGLAGTSGGSPAR